MDGSNCSVDYDYFLGRKDIIYATTGEIKRLEGVPADFPKLPVVPEGTLGLCSVDCPPDSVKMTVLNFGLTRITMDQIHEIIQDVEDLKYNDAQFHCPVHGYNGCMVSFLLISSHFFTTV